MSKAIGFIGLGVMGFHMAGHLSKYHELSVFNRSLEKTNNWTKEFNGFKCDTVKDVCQRSDVLILCLCNDKDVRDIIFEKEGALEHLKPDSLIVDHTTTSSDLPIEINESLNSKGIYFLDAPISGGQPGAEKGQLSIMVGGDESIFDKYKFILEPYSKFIKYMGPSGSGQLTKMVNQICIAGLLQGLSEGMNFSDRVGLDTNEVIDVISKGAAQSWQMENRADSMIKDFYNHGFAVDLMSKDLKIVLDKANDSNINMEVTNLVNNYYKEIQKAGGGKWDTSSLYKRLKDII